ncbi:hypothetical protein GW17_00006276 [Ensete ventricosum]|nr:hypothetical protein GW17_00006276 [Ensete ventricosum]
MVHSPLDIMIEVSLANQVLDLVLQVLTLFGVVAVFTVETIVSTVVPFFGSDLNAVRWCQESLPPYLEEDLGPRGVERSRRGPWAAEGLGCDEVVCPLHHLGDCGWRFLDQRPKQFGRAYAHQKGLDD